MRSNEKTNIHGSNIGRTVLKSSYLTDVFKFVKVREIQNKSKPFCLTTAQRRAMGCKTEGKPAPLLYSYGLTTLKSLPEQNFSECRKDLRRPVLTGQIHTDPKPKSHDFDPDDKSLSLDGQELAQ